MNIFLGNPPENIKQWIIDDYNRKQEEKRKAPLCFEAVDAGATIALKCYGDNLKTATFQTSTDGNAWTDYTYETSITLTNVGDKVYFKAKGDNTAIARDYSNYLQFTTTQEAKKVNVSGNVMSLLAPEFKDLLDLSTIRSGNTGTYQFYRLFQNCKSISDCRNLILPATTLASCCYYSMFQSCSNLTQAPTLPATTLADSCYYSMFSGCSSLTQAPAIQATTLADSCYSSMFYKCTSLLSAPALPATTLAEYCYNTMFKGCTSLIQAPELPATTLVNSCYYYMFSGCSSLAQAPALPATTFDYICCAGMFSGCSNLTQAPEIKTYTPDLHAYAEMLGGSLGKLTTCIWSDLTVAEAESMVLYEQIFGFDDSGSGVRISITCKDGSGVAYYDSGKSSWVFEY